LKALQEYQISIDLVDASSPAIQYRILSEIITEQKAFEHLSTRPLARLPRIIPDPYSLAIYYNQPKLIDALNIQPTRCLRDQAYASILKTLEQCDRSLYNRVVSDLSPTHDIVEYIYIKALGGDYTNASKVIAPEVDYSRLVEITKGRTQDLASVEFGHIQNQPLLDAIINPELARQIIEQNLQRNPVWKYLLDHQ